MKNLGHFNEESIARFTEHFEDNIEFSESTEDFVDFARCQRPDGSIYGTGGQCRLGTPTSDKAPEKKTARKSAKASDGATSAKTKAPSDLKAKATELREMNKVAKAAEKKAEAADRAWRKGGMKDKELQREVRRLDKVAKAADREAEKSGRELVRMKKAAEREKGRSKNVKLNDALKANPKATASQRQSAMRVLRQERNRLESMKDEGKLSKVGEARLKLVKASQRQYEI